MTGEYSVSLLQELLTQRNQWTEERQDLVHRLEVITDQVCPNNLSYQNSRCYRILYMALSFIDGYFQVVIVLIAWYASYCSNS